MPWARIGELVGHDDLMTTAKTYTHVVADEAEPDYEALLEPPSGRLSAASAHRTR
jgi:integrase